MGYREGVPVEHARLHHERRLLAEGCLRIAGVDEVGRGPLAGPVVAAAVMLPESWLRGGMPRGLAALDDSKRLSPRQREAFHRQLTSSDQVRFGVAILAAEVIDRLNILRATHAAMVEALRQLDPEPGHVLVDGLAVAAITQAQTAIVGGDGLSYSIAAASVVAKVTRDRLMLGYHERWPAYGFARHKGYPTREHLQALARLGPCPIHRRSFAPVESCQMEFRMG